MFPTTWKHFNKNHSQAVGETWSQRVGLYMSIWWTDEAHEPCLFSVLHCWLLFEIRCTIIIISAMKFSILILVLFTVRIFTSWLTCDYMDMTNQSCSLDTIFISPFAFINFKMLNSYNCFTYSRPSLNMSLKLIRNFLCKTGNHVSQVFIKTLQSKMTNTARKHFLQTGLIQNTYVIYPLKVLRHASLSM